VTIDLLYQKELERTIALYQDLPTLHVCLFGSSSEQRKAIALRFAHNKEEDCFFDIDKHTHQQQHALLDKLLHKQSRAIITTSSDPALLIQKGSLLSQFSSFTAQLPLEIL